MQTQSIHQARTCKHMFSVREGFAYIWCVVKYSFLFVCVCGCCWFCGRVLSCIWFIAFAEFVPHEPSATHTKKCTTVFKARETLRSSAPHHKHVRKRVKARIISLIWWYNNYQAHHHTRTHGRTTDRPDARMPLTFMRACAPALIEGNYIKYFRSLIIKLHDN